MNAYQRRLTQIRAAAAGRTLRSWRGLRTYDDADIARWVGQVRPLVLGAQAQAVALTDAWMSLRIGLATGSTTRPVGLPVEAFIGPAVRAGVPMETVYTRPAITMRTLLGNGTPFADALRAATARVEQTVLTDVQLATTHAAHARLDADRRVVGYRRILGAGNNCGLCIVASTQRYRKENLMPIHPHCGCTVEPTVREGGQGGVGPLLGTEDPGQVIDRDRLLAVTQGHGGTRSELGRLRVDGAQLPSNLDPALLPDVEVVNHGELGPLLWDAAHTFDALN